MSGSSQTHEARMVGVRRSDKAPYWRSQAMAEASGLEVLFFEEGEIEALAARCGKCVYGDKCLLWHLEAGSDAPGPPAYCENREWIEQKRAMLHG